MAALPTGAFDLVSANEAALPSFTVQSATTGNVWVLTDGQLDFGASRSGVALRAFGWSEAPAGGPYPTIGFYAEVGRYGDPRGQGAGWTLAPVGPGVDPGARDTLERRGDTLVVRTRLRRAPAAAAVPVRLRYVPVAP